MSITRPIFRCSSAAIVSTLLLACGGNSQTDADDTKNSGQPIEEARSDQAHDTNPAVTDAAYRQLVSGNNEFAFDAFGKLATKGDSNVFYSPLSMSVALAMTYAGARGSTETQMAKALHFTLSQADLHPGFNKLILDLASRNIAQHDTREGPKSLRLSLVNAAWAQKGYQFVPTYLDTLAVQYDAGIKLLDFMADPSNATTVINQWVEQKTEGKIKGLLPDGAVDRSTRLVLTNTLYFYGTWSSVFDVKSTTTDVFHSPGADVTVPTMHATRSIGYAEGDGWQIAELPYDGGALAMTIVLPAAGRFDEIRGALTSGWLDQRTTEMQGFSGEVGLSLPKFKFTWGTESLKPMLQALGMVDAFVFPTADFSGMEPKRELYVGDVLHKAFVGVDENGTEAAAATAVIMRAGSVPMQPKAFTVDRPFVFFIRDKTGALLFVGQVANPAGSYYL